MNKNVGYIYNPVKKNRGAATTSRAMRVHVSVRVCINREKRSSAKAIY